MKTIKIKVYEFSELSEDAQQRVIRDLYDLNIDYNWWDFTYDDAKGIGLEITSFDFDRRRHAKGSFLLSPAEVAQNIFNNHGSECETYRTAQNFMNEWQPIFNNYLDESHVDYESSESEDKMLSLESDCLSSLLEDYSIMLQKEYEYLQSDEAIIETIKANSYTFFRKWRYVQFLIITL
jgi:hypothetical protein